MTGLSSAAALAKLLRRKFHTGPVLLPPEQRNKLSEWPVWPLLESAMAVDSLMWL